MNAAARGWLATIGIDHDENIVDADPSNRVIIYRMPDGSERHRVRCEIWSRVMGYCRPVESMNRGKQAEHQERVPFEEARANESTG